jgi:hypothetical protein
MGHTIPAILRRLTAAAILVAASAATAAQTAPPSTKLVEPPTPLLPQNIGDLAADTVTRADPAVIDNVLQQFEFFNPSTCLPVINPPGAAPHPMSTAAAYCANILKEDGVRRLAAGTYRRNSTGPASEISVFEFVDATGAYSAYTFYRTLLNATRLVGPPAGQTTLETLADSAGTVTWSGTNVVRIRGTLSKEEMTVLLAGLPKASGRKAIAPALPSLFPPDVSGTKLESATIRYSLGPIGYKTLGGQLPPDMLGWDKSVEVATATYAGKQGKGILTLLLYPTPQIAGDNGRAIEKALNDAGAAQLGTVKLRRNGPLLSLATGGFNPDQAEKLVQAAHLDEQLTFDQKLPLEFHAEVKKTATLLESILIFTGLLIIAAIVIGVFLGGIRAGWRVMHGKPAASEPEFLTINLRGDPKGVLLPKEPDSDDVTS